MANDLSNVHTIVELLRLNPTIIVRAGYETMLNIDSDNNFRVIHGIVLLYCGNDECLAVQHFIASEIGQANLELERHPEWKRIFK